MTQCRFSVGDRVVGASRSAYLRQEGLVGKIGTIECVDTSDSTYRIHWDGDSWVMWVYDSSIDPANSLEITDEMFQQLDQLYQNSR